MSGGRAGKDGKGENDGKKSEKGKDKETDKGKDGKGEKGGKEPEKGEGDGNTDGRVHGSPTPPGNVILAEGRTGKQGRLDTSVWDTDIGGANHPRRRLVRKELRRAMRNLIRLNMPRGAVRHRRDVTRGGRRVEV